MEFLAFILFCAWSYGIYRIAHSTGKLNGGRDGARALARLIQHEQITDPDVIESYAERIDVKKILSTFDKGGKRWDSYGR